MFPKFEKSFPLVRRACRDKSINKLDVDPRRDDDASPMSSHSFMLKPTSMILAFNKSKLNFNTKN